MFSSKDMFTGLVETVAEIVAATPTGGGMRLRIGSPLAAELTPGDSLAVNGVCLTVVQAKDAEIHADIGPETLRVTTLGGLGPGSLVNLERPLRADSRLGGHFVQGHVDAVGYVEDLRHGDNSHWLTLAFPRVLAPCIVAKGSIAVDGISLTVAGLGSAHFDVMIIPHTFEHTNVRAMKVRDKVNLECDVIGKYVVRAAELAGLTLSPVRAGDVTN
jgi:riboflavin synthase